MKRKFINAYCHIYHCGKEVAERKYDLLDKETKIMVINYWFDLRHPNYFKELQKQYGTAF